ncbi:glycoside hydrolase family 25 protein [Tellurirhabdus bombi]|uniref:glycoside hydrolase family 25 protein n=1 Tax=Tellurirhabdus bombi TaxID=2907205 RepID=UPI001F2046AD|nr:glycoside hydrolase family 25 protein [Tellurirhabdus bombi]
MERIILFLYRTRKTLVLPLLAIAVLFGLWWLFREGEVQKREWHYIPDFGIRVPTAYPIHGIDVSHHNKKINWQKVRRIQANGIGLQFVFVKATEGVTLVDRQFKTNWREAGKAGLKRGAYHFYHPRRDAEKQAKNFIKTVDLDAGDFAPVLDFEIDWNVNSEKLIADLQLWLNLVENHYGVKPIIYTNRHFYRRYIAGNFDDYPLWLADYTKEHLDDYQTERLYFWQHNKGGSVSGIRGQVDFNVFLFDSTRVQEVCL